MLTIYRGSDVTFNIAVEGIILKDCTSLYLTFKQNNVISSELLKSQDDFIITDDNVITVSLTQRETFYLSYRYLCQVQLKGMYKEQVFSSDIATLKIGKALNEDIMDELGNLPEHNSPYDDVPTENLNLDDVNNDIKALNKKLTTETDNLHKSISEINISLSVCKQDIKTIYSSLTNIQTSLEDNQSQLNTIKSDVITNTTDINNIKTKLNNYTKCFITEIGEQSNWHYKLYSDNWIEGIKYITVDNLSSDILENNYYVYSIPVNIPFVFKNNQVNIFCTGEINNTYTIYSGTQNKTINENSIDCSCTFLCKSSNGKGVFSIKITGYIS